MKVVPIPSGAQAAPMGEGLRTLTMNTNATPPASIEAPQSQTPIADPGEIKDNEAKSDSETEATQPISHQYAALRKAQRAAQVKEAELKAREQELSTKFNDKDFVPVSQLKQGALKTLLGLGVTYDQLREELMANQANPDISRLEGEIKALKEGVDSKFNDSVEQQKQQILGQMKQEAIQLTAEGDTFALVRQTKSIPKVMQLIDEAHSKHGQVLTTTEALTLVEAELEKEAELFLSADKIRSKFAPQPQTLPPRQSGMRTLTNKDTASPPMSAKQRAMAAFYGRPTT